MGLVVWSPKMSRRPRSKKEVREIWTDDVMVVPVPVLLAGQHATRSWATGPKWINNSFAASPHVRVGTGPSIDDWRITEVCHFAVKQTTRMMR